jgi:hypothetical protein
MQPLRDPDQLQQVEPENLRQWLVQQFTELSSPEPYDPDQPDVFILVEGGDTVESLEAATDLPLLTGLFGDAVFGVDDDFVPAFEMIEDHGSFFELVYLFTDGGPATVVVVPNQAGIDPRLLLFCRTYAESG